MVTITTNIKEVSISLLKKLYAIETPENKDKLSREVCITLAGEMRERIHERGQDSSGAQIGVYTPAYLKFRQFGYKSKIVTRGNKKGEARPIMSYNRTADPKVILSLSHAMENDFTLGKDNTEPTKTETGYGIGFKNFVNFEKSQWCEETYGKPIYNLTQSEKDMVPVIAEEFIHNAFNK